jgi:hypothetical protein
MAPASAQVTGLQCIDLAKSIVARDSVQLTDQQYDALAHYAYCEATSQSDSHSLSIAYKAFSLGGVLGKEERKEFCKKSLTDIGISRSEYQKTTIFFSQALATIDKCLAAAEAGWTVNYQQIQKDAISLGIKHLGETGGVLHGVDVIPKQALDCEGIPEKLPITVTADQPITITCVRTPDIQFVHGREIRSAQDATLNLRFANGPLPLTLRGYSDSIFDQISAEIVAIKESLAETQAQIATYSQNLAKWEGDEKQVTSINQKMLCPDGQYVVGIYGEDRDHGKFCTTCISAVRFYCRPLPKP